MSGPHRLLLILHIGFAIFTLGPLTAATMATPRYIRRGDVAVLRYLRRATHLYWLLSFGVILFGVFAVRGGFAKVWLTASITLTTVALVLLLIVERDQAKAIKALEGAAAARAAASEPPAEAAEGAEPEAAGEPAAKPTLTPETRTIVDLAVAEVERGRIASISGVVALLWIVILILMVWH
jgi:hypothetical protein